MNAPHASTVAGLAEAGSAFAKATVDKPGSATPVKKTFTPVLRISNA